MPVHPRAHTTCTLGVLTVAALLIGVLAGGPASGSPSAQTASASASTDATSQSAENALPATPPVLEPSAVIGSTAPSPSETGLRTALDPILDSPDLGGTAAAVVIDPATGAELFDRDGEVPLMPASTAKLLTAAGVLVTLGPQRRLATRVMAYDDALVLVGGGDPSLVRTTTEDDARPSLAELAELVEPQVSGAVRLLYDASLFGAPALAPGWSQSLIDQGFVAPVAALAVDQGRVAPDTDMRSPDPALAAAESFASALRERGVEVTEVQPGETPEQAVELARVESAPVAELVTTMLADSDNDAAEMLAHVAGAERSGVGTFASASRATVESLRELAVSVAGVELADASGLSTDNRVPVDSLAALLAVVADPARGESLWPIGPGLAVAGFTGTLVDRFVSMPTAAGVVRAKTGTLDGVSGLAGTLRDLDGRVLVFAVLSNSVPDVYAGRAALDSFATTLVGCGCE